MKMLLQMYGKFGLTAIGICALITIATIIWACL